MAVLSSSWLSDPTMGMLRPTLFGLQGTLGSGLLRSIDICSRAGELVPLPEESGFHVPSVCGVSPGRVAPPRVPRGV